MLDVFLRWGASFLLLAVFFACAWNNLDNVFEFTRGMRERRIPGGSRVSPIMFIGGIAGAVALVLWPEPDLKAYWWLPFLIDFPGTVGIGHGGAEAGADTLTEEERSRSEEAARLERWSGASSALQWATRSDLPARA